MNTGRRDRRRQPMTDADDVWDLQQGIDHRRASPRASTRTTTPASSTTSTATTFGRNSIDDQGMKIISKVHYGQGYCNAFWNGSST